jgi:hypothetical protein
MAVKAKIDSIERDVQLIVSEMLSPEAQGREIAAYASGEIAKTDNINRSILGRVPPRRTWVNGSEGAALDTIRPGGAIVTEWEIVTDLLEWFARTLIERSPRVTGDYIRGHTLFADGVEVPRGAEIPAGATEFVFINLVPYVRRIEVGKTDSGRDFVIQVPNRIYERTYKDGKARFGNQAKITFGYETQIGAYRLKFDQKHRTWNKGRGHFNYRKRQSPDRVAGSTVNAPAIRISLKDF